MAEKVTKEVAENEFVQLAQAWDIFDNTDDMTPDDLESFNEQKSKIISKIMRGSATVDLEEESLVLVLRDEAAGVSSVKFKEPLGSAWIKMGDGASKKNANGISQINKFLGEVTGLPSVTFSKMRGSDYKFCQAVALLFLG